LPSGKKRWLTHAHAAHEQTLALQRLHPLPEDQFRAAAADVDHQPLSRAHRQTVRHAQVDEAGLFAAGDHLDRVAERRLGGPQEDAAVAHLPQGVGADRAHRVVRQGAQALAEARQAVQGALLRLDGELLALVQAGAQAHALAQAVDDLELTVVQVGDDHVKAVGAEIDRGDGVRGGLEGLMGRHVVRATSAGPAARVRVGVSAPAGHSHVRKGETRPGC
jgi:hypothetical protein